MHSLENIVVAITNLPAYYPIMIAFNNLWDILGCILVIIRYICLIYYVQISFPSYENIFYIIIAYIFHLISQYDNTKYKWLYILSHCIWHILIFIVMGKIIE